MAQIHCGGRALKKQLLKPLGLSYTTCGKPQSPQHVRLPVTYEYSVFLAQMEELPVCLAVGEAARTVTGTLQAFGNVNSSKHP